MKRRTNHASATVIVVLVTCPSRAVGRRLATHLVRARLCACVNLLPRIESIFWWKGTVDRSREVLLLMKTASWRFEALKRAVIKMHPYDLPEVIAVPVSAGYVPYLRWVASTSTSA